MLIQYIDRLLEGAMSPFKRKSTLDNGPRGGSRDKTGDWSCKCKDYVCKCIGPKGKKKTMKTKPDAKKAYNKDYKQHPEYKAWRARVITGQEPPEHPNRVRRRSGR